MSGCPDCLCAGLWQAETLIEKGASALSTPSRAAQVRSGVASILVAALTGGGGAKAGASAPGASESKGDGESESDRLYRIAQEAEFGEGTCRCCGGCCPLFRVLHFFL